MSTIKIRRGNNASLPSGGTVAGEPRFSTDTGQFYIDDGTNNIEITPNTTNVAAAGALMDSEVTNLADVKAFDPTDYAAASHTHTESDITDLGSYIEASGVTYENLNSNGDVGTGATQVAAGNHTHSGVYEPADATILKEADVDDTPVNGATTAPVSSNWAYDHDVSASDTVEGHVELATAAETTTGTDATRAVTPDGLAGSDYGKRVIGLQVFSDADDVATGDGAGDLFFRIPSVMNGWELVAVAASVQTAGTTGTTDIQIHNVTQATDFLSTKLTIDSGETDSSTAATAAVISGADDNVATGEQIRIDVDAVSTTAPKGLYVELIFQKP